MARSHREPLSSFVLTLGAADMVIGGVGDRLSLFLLGLTVAGIGLLLRWASLKRQPSLEPNLETRLLPPATSANREGYRERRVY
jgi:hypothetical protein